MVLNTSTAAVNPSHRAAAIEVLMGAFARDPTLGWCFGAWEDGYASRLRAYLEAGHDFHVALGQPVEGAFAGGDLVGVVYAMTPEAEVSDADLAALRARLEDGCGAESARRFFQYHEVMEAIVPAGPCHVLAVVGVRDGFRGRGVGTRLVQWVGELCDGHASSLGVRLDTGTDRNVAFYQRLGYQVIGQESFDGLVERVMFRPRAG